MTFDEKRLLALSVGKAAYGYIFTECRLIFSKIRLVFVSLFKTPTSRITFYSIILALSCIILFSGSGKLEPNMKYDSIEIIVKYTVIFIWLIFIIIMIYGGCQAYIINSLKAELASENEHFQLHEKVCFFSKKAKISVPSIYLNNKSSKPVLSTRKIFGDGILILNLKALNAFKEDEIDSLIACEMCHLKYYDFLVNIILGSTVLPIFVLCWLVLLTPIDVIRESCKGVKSSYKSYEKVLYVFGIIFIVPMAILVVIFGYPIRNIFYEQATRADLWSCFITKNSLALKNAISKISDYDQVPGSNSCKYDEIFHTAKSSSRNWVQRKMLQFLLPCAMRRIDNLT